MRSGKLNHLVTIQSKTEVNTVGQMIPTWGTLTTAWASIEPTGGNESEGNQKISATTSHKITIRYKSGISAKANRILWGTRVFDINAIMNTKESDEELILLCKEAV